MATVSRAIKGLAFGCAALVGLSLLVLLSPRLHSLLIGDRNAPVYRVGGQADVPESVYSAHERTVIVFARSSCAACQRAKLLLRAIATDLAAEFDWHAVLVSAGLDMEAEVEFAREIGVGPTFVLPAPDDLRLTSVPTILVVDQGGRILASYEGILWSEGVHDSVLAGVRRVGPGGG